MKGSWLLRKAWKIYQRTYTQLYELYIERFGNEDNDDDANYRPRMFEKYYIQFMFIIISFY